MSSGYHRLGANVPGKALRPVEGPMQSLLERSRHGAPILPPKVSDTLTEREIARSQGFTGDTCSNCGGAHMQVAGHCYVCADCGTTTGCS